MKNIVYAGLAAAMILGGSMLSGANAMPLAQHSGISQASGVPVVEVKWKSRGHTMRHSNRGHHYGWSRGRGNPHRFNRWR
jgi:hypothetical protein